MLKIEKILQKETVYDITVEDNHNFYANDILVHNCQEIVLPTTPLQSLEDGDDTDAEIALCTLAGYNLGAIKNMETLKLASKYIIFILDKIIDLQDYPVPAARKMLKRRSIGVGVTNYAYWLMKNDNEYGSKEALIATDELFEHIQYYLLEASNEIAKEKGAAEWFHRTKYVDGIFTKDHYNKNVDKLVKRKHTLDWKTLKKNVMEFGLRNSVFTALMPVESCVSKETKIKTEDDIKSYEDILIEQNIDFKSLEEKGEQIWIDFEKPFNVETMNGLDTSERIFYNGKKEVYSITFEDNNVYKMTGNHKLLVNRNDEEIWTRVDELKEGDNIVNIEDSYTKIIKIEKVGKEHTYDLEVKNEHHYILDNGCVSHNSSLVSSSINGIELPKALITQKKSKSGSPLPVVVPEIAKYKNKYQLGFSVSNSKINDTVSVIQKWIDQAISVNHYYDKTRYEDGNIPSSDVVKDILQFYKFGGKQLYYANSKDNMSDKLSDMIGTDDEDDDIYIEDDNAGCESGACSL